MSAYEQILFEQDDAITTISINQPNVLNALSNQTNEELIDAIKRAGETSRALIITGIGRAFCSGANLLQQQQDNSGAERDLGESLGRYYDPMIAALMDSPIPTISAVNGPAAGFGCSLALACDLVTASESAYFQQVFVNIGLIPDGASAYFLTRSIGRAKAMELMLLGDKLLAPEALDLGLINRVFSPEELLPETQTLAKRLSKGATKALGMTRKLTWAALNNNIDEQLAVERVYQRDAGRTKDFEEGVMAFLQKRPANFTGE